MNKKAIRRSNAFQGTKSSNFFYMVWILANLFSSVVLAVLPQKSIWMLAQILTASLGYFLICGFEDKVSLIQEANKVVRPLIYFYALGYAFYLLHISGSGLGMLSPSHRLTGWSYESNILGSQAIFWMAVVYQWRSSLPKKQTWFFVAISVVVVGTGTRAAIISLLVVAIYHLISNLKYSQFSIQFLIAIPALVIILISSTVFSSISQEYSKNSIGRVASLVDLNSQTATYRLRVYRIAFDDINSFDLSRKLFGSGTNSFAQVHPLDISRVETGYLSDIWLEVWYDVGIIGLISFLMMLFTLIKRTRKVQSSSIIFWTTMAMCASTTSMVWFSYLWLFIGLLEFKDPTTQIWSLKTKRLRVLKQQPVNQ